MLDESPSEITMLGVEPKVDYWPKVTKRTPVTENIVYPGVGSELFHGEK
jgi:hypothetical protein